MIAAAAIQTFQEPKPPELSVLTAQLWGLIAGSLGLSTREPVRT